MDSKKYWEFKLLSNKEANLYLYVEIADWGAGCAAHSAQSFKQELDDLGEIDILNMYINSPGGDVFEGLAIFNMLKRKQYYKVAYIDGLAASIASVIAMAADKIIMPSNTMMMIHNAWGGCIGYADDLRKYADSLDKMCLSAKQIYLDKARTKLDDETITNIMNAESWLTAQECYDYGLCDEIIGAKQVAAKWDSSFFNAKNYKNVPKNFLNISKEVNPIMDETTKLFIQRIKNKTK